MLLKIIDYLNSVMAHADWLLRGPKKLLELPGAVRGSLFLEALRGARDKRKIF